MDMKLRISRSDNGAVVLGAEIPSGFMPLLVWGTWVEFLAFATGVNEFVEEVYKQSEVELAIIKQINSIKEIDTL